MNTILRRVEVWLILMLLGIDWSGAFGAEAAERATIPSAAAQREALRLVKDVFAKEYGEAETSTQKITFAKKLLDEARKVNPGTANHYALLRVARDVAVQAGDVEVAIQLVEAIAAVYDVDVVKAKIVTIQAITASARSTAERTTVATVALGVVDEAVAADRFDGAAQLIELAQTNARKARDWQLVRQIVARGRQVKQAAAARQEADQALAALENDPTDPAANQTAGEYFCFERGDWSKGMPMLALGSDKTLKSLAQQDLQGADSAREQVALGDQWWELAQTRPAAQKGMLMRRAGHWYRQAKTNLESGLILTKVERRLDEIDKSPEPVAKVAKTRLQVPQGSILLMTFEPDTLQDRNGTAQVSDLSGHDNHGILSGAKPVPNGRAGAAMQFAGGGCILLPTLRTQLVGNLRQFSISLWALPAGGNRDHFLFDVGHWASDSITVFYNEPKYAFYLPDKHGGDSCSSQPVEPGRWVHIVGVWDGAQQKIYIDGQVSATVPTRGLTLSAKSVFTHPARLGTVAKDDRRGRRSYRGLLDEVAIFPRVLSDAEIQSLYRLGSQSKTFAGGRNAKSGR